MEVNPSRNSIGWARLFFYTLLNLRRFQIIGRLAPKIYKPVGQRALSPRALNGRLEVIPWREPSLLEAEKFTFLNETKLLKSSETGWTADGADPLWLYHLHYFDDLHAKGCEKRSQWHRDLIEKWILENPIGVGPGWAPYSTSLRVVNWVKWHLKGNELSKNAQQSLCVQLRWLNSRIEYRIGGNHLLANAKALVLGGLLFDGEEANRWLARGAELFSAQMSEQILNDGGHYERSPMYQAILIEDLLDLRSVLKMAPDALNLSQFFINVESHLNQMLPWLSALTHPDGTYSHFNDVSLGAAPNQMELFDLATALGIEQKSSRFELVHHQESGYVRFENKNAVVISDAGLVGPKYVNGHAHADTLSFEMSLFGQRIIVNSGTSTYWRQPLRSWQRSTAYHNTVVVNGLNSSEVWSQFRTARMARPFDTVVEASEDGLTFSSAHDGYGRIGVIHRRQLGLKSNSLEITDRLEGSYMSAEAHLFFHPDVHLVKKERCESSTIWYFSIGEASFMIQSASPGEILGSIYYPSFGVSLPNLALVLNFSEHVQKVLIRW